MSDDLMAMVAKLRHVAGEISKLVGSSWRYETAEQLECDPDDVGIGPVGRNRDSQPLAESNFRVILADLQAVDERVTEVSFGHWGCGWIEEIAIPLDNPEIVGRVVFWAEKLAAYPIADDFDYAEVEHEHAVAATATTRYCHECRMWISAVLAILDEPSDSGWVCDTCGEWILCDECGSVWSEAHDEVCAASPAETDR